MMQRILSINDSSFHIHPSSIDSGSEETDLLLNDNNSQSILNPIEPSPDWSFPIPQVKLHRHSHVVDDSVIAGLSNHESLDHSMPMNRVYRARKIYNFIDTSYPRRRSMFKWFLYFCVGVLSGIVGFTIRFSIAKLYQAKFEILHHFEYASGAETFFLYLTINCLFAGISAIFTQFFAPAAAGSGIPEVMTYLNGIRTRSTFSLKTFIGNLFSAIFTVSSGLIAGPEGPSIHAGAIIGAAFSQLRSATIGQGLTSEWAQMFRNRRDRRDFIAVGAAAGVSAAFKAPLAGALFMLEELPIRITNPLLWQALFSSLIAGLSIDIMESLFTDSSALDAGRIPADIAGNDYFQPTSKSGFYLNFIPLVIIIGIVGGILGSLFTRLGLSIAAARKRFYDNKHPYPRIRVFRKLREIAKRHEPFVKVVEVLIVVILTTIFGFAFSYLWGCRKVPDVFHVNSGNGGPSTQEESSHTYYVRFQCKKGYYNEFATLFINDPESSVGHLLFRGSPNNFGIASLSLALIGSLLGTVSIAGLGVSAGLIIPLLFIGSSFGRLAGVICHKIFHGVPVGIFALYGTSAFLGGVTRLPLTFTVILLSLTADFVHLIPIMLAMVLGKIVADFSSHHTFYHGLIEVKEIPFLDPLVPKICDLLTAEHIMSRKIVSLPESPSVQHTLEILRNHPHHSKFPIMKKSSDSSSKSLVGGLLSRRILHILLAHEIFTNSPLESCLPNIDDQGYDSPACAFATSPAGNLIWQNAQSVPSLKEIEILLESRATSSLFLDLKPFYNPSPVAIKRTCTVSAVYAMFTQFGLSSIVVLEDDGRLAGLVTRKDLLLTSLENIVCQSGRIKWTESAPPAEYGATSDI